MGPTGGAHHKGNLNRLAFTANNFYDSRNLLGGVQQYGMRPSADQQNVVGTNQPAQPTGPSQPQGTTTGQQAMSR